MHDVAKANGSNRDRRVFVVAGMHRAGTSTVASGLQALGVGLGDRLMSADPRMNARGFFEDVDIVAIDDALLAMVDADWKSVALLDAVDWSDDRFSGMRAKARALLESRFAASAWFGFKDPRVPRLVPFWQTVFADVAAADGYVIAVRHPLSVIASLSARDRLDVRRSAWLWLTHLLCALRFTAGRSRVVVDYDRMLAEPRRELARVAHALALPDSALHTEAVRAFADDFVSLELRHAVHPPEEIGDAQVPALALPVHSLAQRLAREDIDPNAPSILAEVEARFSELLEFAPLLAYAGTTERVADDVPRLAGELDWARGSLAQAAAYSDDLRAKLGVAETYALDLRANLERIEGELVAANDRLQRIASSVLGRVAVRLSRNKR